MDWQPLPSGGDFNAFEGQLREWIPPQSMAIQLVSASKEQYIEHLSKVLGFDKLQTTLLLVAKWMEDSTTVREGESGGSSESQCLIGNIIQNDTVLGGNMITGFIESELVDKLEIEKSNANMLIELAAVNVLLGTKRMGFNVPYNSPTAFIRLDDLLDINKKPGKQFLMLLKTSPVNGPNFCTMMNRVALLSNLLTRPGRYNEINCVNLQALLLYRLDVLFNNDDRTIFAMDWFVSCINRVMFMAFCVLNDKDELLWDLYQSGKSIAFERSAIFKFNHFSLDSVAAAMFLNKPRICKKFWTNFSVLKPLEPRLYYNIGNINSILFLATGILDSCLVPEMTQCMALAAQYLKSFLTQSHFSSWMPVLFDVRNWAIMFKQHLKSISKHMRSEDHRVADISACLVAIETIINEN